MKKMMFALAASVAIGAFAVESANTVGYETRSLTPGQQVINGANFVTVGENAMSIQSIKMDDGVGDGECAIWWWNTATGKYDAKAFWYTELYADEEGETTLGYAGWGDFDYWMPVSKTFAPGESFWVQPNGGLSSATMTLAGEITGCDAAEEYLGVDLTPGAQVQMTNPFPVGSFDLQSIKMDEGVGDGECAIWWWNTATGRYDAKAFWYTELYADEDGETTLGYAGWGDFDYWMPVSKTFEAGQGFWIQPNGGLSEATVKFVNPFYQAQ